MTVAALRPTLSFRSDESRLLMIWAFCWILLPNAGFWLLWIVGAPPRVPEILATGAAGLIVRHRSWAVQFATFIALLLYSALSFIAGLFNLAIASLMASLRFMSELNPVASFEYLIAAAGVVATLAAATRALRAPTGFKSIWALLVAIGLIFGAAGLDRWMSRGMRGHYKRVAPAGAAFSSAVQTSGFAAGVAGRRHLILVTVEAMGLPVDPAMRARLIARWRQPDIASRYDVSTGAAPYFGSTTSGELRELCGRWGEYEELLQRVDSGCLPARLQASGYRTTALHGFDGTFFDRTTWYPHIGFDRMLFRDTLVANGAGKCAGVFPGACDRDVPRQMADLLVGAREPQFLYWLTLNSHLPVPADSSLQTGACKKGELPIVAEHAMICRQFQLWDEVAGGLADQLLRPDFPAADILLVGDHMPPYFDRAQRSKFDPEQVPWILLRRR